MVKSGSSLKTSRGSRTLSIIPLSFGKCGRMMGSPETNSEFSCEYNSHHNNDR